MRAEVINDGGYFARTRVLVAHGDRFHRDTYKITDHPIPVEIVDRLKLVDGDTVDISVDEIDGRVTECRHEH